MNLLTSNIMNKIIDVLDFFDHAETLEDDLMQTYLKFVHVLNSEAAKIIEISSDFNMDVLFYSEYYWFTKYKNRHFELYGHDEGLEQRAFKMLENMSLENEVDWSIIEQIDNGTIRIG